MTTRGVTSCIGVCACGGIDIRKTVTESFSVMSLASSGMGPGGTVWPSAQAGAIPQTSSAAARMLFMYSSVQSLIPLALPVEVHFKSREKNRGRHDDWRSGLARRRAAFGDPLLREARTPAAAGAPIRTTAL